MTSFILSLDVIPIAVRWGERPEGRKLNRRSCANTTAQSGRDKMQITIATRHHPTLDGYPLIDRLVRKGRRLFLIESPEPGGREVVKPISLRYAFQWLREMPDQIERAVIAGGLAA